MEVIVACPSLNFSGGAEKLCMHLIKALRNKNYHVVLTTLDKTDWISLEKAFGESFRPNKETYIFSTMPRVPTLTLRQAFIAFFYILELSWMFSRKKCAIMINMRGEIIDSIGDIVYVNSVPLKLMYIYPEIQPRRGAQWTLFSRIYSSVTKNIRKGKNTIVANSAFTRGIILDNLKRNALVVHPAIDARKIAPPSKNVNRENLVITISRFRSAKGLEIIPEIANRVSNGTFVLIGNADSDSRDLLTKITQRDKELGLQDRFQVFANVPFQFVLKKMQAAKVILGTQLTEAFGMAIVEAMESGCVPVVPRGGGPWCDILDRNQGLYGYSYRNIEEAAELVQMLLDNEKLRSEVSARAQLRAVDFASSFFERDMLRIVEKTTTR